MKKLLVILLLATISLTACSDSSSESESETTTSIASPSGEASWGTCAEKPLDLSKKYTVDMTTNKGTFTIALDTDNAPISASHFANLVQEGFYDGLTFHRIIPDFVIQGGDPLGNGTGGYECQIISEEPPREYQAKDLAWAKTATEPAGTAGSQFFVITGTPESGGLAALNTPAPQPNGETKIQYGYFGTVTEGFEIVQAIEALGTPETGEPQETITIIKAELKS